MENSWIQQLKGLRPPRLSPPPTWVKSLIDMSPCPDSEDGDQMPDQSDGGNLYASASSPSIIGSEPTAAIRTGVCGGGR